jgi:hypothetical protein
MKVGLGVRRSGLCPAGTCRTYPEGMTGLSPGFQPRVKSILWTRPERAAETGLGREIHTMSWNELSAAHSGRVRGWNLPGVKTPGLVLSSLRDKSENPRKERCDPWGLALSNVKTIGRARRPTANRFQPSLNKHA